MMRIKISPVFAKLSLDCADEFGWQFFAGYKNSIEKRFHKDHGMPAEGQNA